MEQTFKDPVCGMELTADTVEATSEYEGRTYYFCSSDCQETFEQEPARYARQSQEHRQDRMD